MPLDINRHIDRIRAQPGNNWLAMALKAIQDAFNTQPAAVAPSASVPNVSSTGSAAASTTPATTQTLFVNGVPTKNDSANFNNALPPPPAGSVSVIFQIDNTLPKPNISGSVKMGLGAVLPLANGDTPGPVLIADGIGQCIGVPL